jgi:hypothetical protein
MVSLNGIENSSIGDFEPTIPEGLMLMEFDDGFGV